MLLIVPVRRYAVTPIRRYAVTPIRRYADKPLRRYAVTPIRRYAVTPISRYADKPLRRYANAPLRQYADTPISRYADTPLRRYADTPLRRYAASKYTCRRPDRCIGARAFVSDRCIGVSVRARLGDTDRKHFAYQISIYICFKIFCIKVDRRRLHVPHGLQKAVLLRGGCGQLLKVLAALSVGSLQRLFP